MQRSTSPSWLDGILPTNQNQSILYIKPMCSECTFDYFVKIVLHILSLWSAVWIFLSMVYWILMTRFWAASCQILRTRPNIHYSKQENHWTCVTASVWHSSKKATCWFVLQSQHITCQYRAIQFLSNWTVGHEDPLYKITTWLISYSEITDMSSLHICLQINGKVFLKNTELFV